LFTMIFDIFPNHFFRYLIPNRSHKISIFPKFPTPKLFLYLRMLLEYDTGTDALQHPYYLGNTISRWKRKENMNMIFCYLQRIDLKIMIPGNLLKYFSYSLSNISPQNQFSIFWSPYQMILRIIHRMTGSLQSHAISITRLPCLRQRTFHPRLQNGVFKFCFCIKFALSLS